MAPCSTSAPSLLAASAFANALGFWASPGRKAGRVELWEEKLGLAPRFTGNAATRWGSTVSCHRTTDGDAR